MALTGSHAPGATPLDEEEAEGLIPDHISTLGELNEWEQRNIVRGQEWALKSRLSRFPRILTDGYLRKLHERMFDQTWEWAGQYRTSGKTLGVDWTTIPENVRVVCDDAQYWIRHSTYNPIEMSVRLHHRLVSIHPFPNGNGRHARLMADILLMKHFKLDRLPWGGADLTRKGDTRAEYIAALREADRGGYDRIVAFAGRTSALGEA